MQYLTDSLAMIQGIWVYCRKKTKDQIISRNKVEFLKMVKPGFESAIAGGSIPNIALSDGKGKIDSLAISSTGKYYLTGADDCKAMLWHCDDFKNSEKFEGDHTQTITAVAISKCDKYIVTGSVDKTLVINFISDSKIPISMVTPEPVHEIAISDCSRYIVARLARSAIVLDVTNFDNIKTKVLDGNSSELTSIAISECGRYVVTGSKDKTANLWDISNFDAIKRIPLLGHKTSVNAVEICDSRKYVVTASGSGSIIFYDISDINNIKSKIYQHKNFVKPIGAIAISKCGNYMVSGDFKAFDLYDIRDINNIKTKTYNYYKSFIKSIAFSPCGKFVVICTINSEGSIWDIADFDNIIGTGLAGLTGKINVKMGNCGKYFVTSSGEKVIRWDMACCAFNYLSIDQIEILEELTTKKNLQEILDYYQQIKSKFRYNFQAYIERYIRNRLLIENLPLEIQNLVCSYLEKQDNNPRENISQSNLGINDIAKQVSSVADSKNNSKKCATCNKENAAQRCARCQTTYYCSKSCQKSDWKLHKLVCKKINNFVF